MQLFKKLVPIFKHSLMNFDVKLFCIYKLLFSYGVEMLILVGLANSSAFSELCL